MSTLYKRATLHQLRALKIVSGACRDAGNAHPELKMTKRMARSIAKRAVGTLSAEWPDVLAARSTRWSSKLAVNLGNRQPPGRTGNDPVGGTSATPWGARNSRTRSPLLQMLKTLSKQIAQAKKAGDQERANALIQAAKIIDAVRVINERH